MSSKELNPLPEQAAIKAAAGAVLTILSSSVTPIPGNLTDATVSVKILLRGIAQGAIVVCQESEVPEDKLDKKKTAPPQTG